MRGWDVSVSQPLTHTAVASHTLSCLVLWRWIRRRRCFCLPFPLSHNAAGTHSQEHFAVLGWRRFICYYLHTIFYYSIYATSTSHISTFPRHSHRHVCRSLSWIERGQTMILITAQNRTVSRLLRPHPIGQVRRHRLTSPTND